MQDIGYFIFYYSLMRSPLKIIVINNLFHVENKCIIYMIEI